MKKEYGRSMIEMLGVLAIIGVLSIGGLAGYTMAMNRHRANEILDYAAKCGVIAQTSGSAFGDNGITKTTCNAAEYMGASSKPSVSNLSDIEVERAKQGDTKVTVTFSTKDGVTAALASRAGLSDDTSFVFNVDKGTWTSGTTTNTNTTP